VAFEDIVKLHPRPSGVDRAALVACITACLDCAASCSACADASLSEPDVADMRRCIRLCLDCVDTCTATIGVATRQSDVDLDLLRAMVDTCSRVCAASAEECERHAAHHAHCRVCAEVCRHCERACDELVAAIGKQ
jgi:hypothetical protein